MTAGAGRRIHVYLDDKPIADLKHGATVRVPTEQGPHLLRARCIPLLSAGLPVILDDHETLRVQIYVSTPDELEIQLEDNPDQHPAPPSP
jgi:hypothetical protein